MNRMTKALKTGLMHAPREMRILRMGCSFLKSRMTRKALKTRRNTIDPPPASPHSDTAITACVPRAALRLRGEAREGAGSEIWHQQNIGMDGAIPFSLNLYQVKAKLTRVTKAEAIPAETHDLKRVR
jgi:hypothetical protein